VPVEILAAPVGAPWLKIAEAMDYVTAVGATTVFPTHERTLSDSGLAMHFDRLRSSAESAGGRAVMLAAHESLEI
jgi:hypothetical protein